MIGDIGIRGPPDLRWIRPYTIFLSEYHKMNFCVPYGSREILNVLHCFILSISRPLYGPQKVILRPENKNSTFVLT